MTSHDGLAPIKRATIFFGMMAAVVATLTFGAGIQGPADQSSATVAEAKLRQNIPADSEFAAAQRDERIAMPIRRAIAASQEARLATPGGSVVR
jgi:hypothetical protein